MVTGPGLTWAGCTPCETFPFWIDGPETAVIVTLSHDPTLSWYESPPPTKYRNPVGSGGRNTDPPLRYQPVGAKVDVSPLSRSVMDTEVMVLLSKSNVVLTLYQWLTARLFHASPGLRGSTSIELVESKAR